jgi:hypothetical protein
VTISGLLGKMNGRTPLFVTVAGTLISDVGVWREANGYQHVEHGRVSPIAKHTFHEGEDPTENRVHEPWWVADPTMLQRERANMALAFPGFTEGTTAGAPSWKGEIDTGRGRFTVEVVHREDHGLPMIEVLKPKRLERPSGRRLVGAPHRYLSGKICVAEARDWDPAVHDAVVPVGWAAHWLAAYTIWRTNLRWPWAGVEVEAV